MNINKPLQWEKSADFIKKYALTYAKNRVVIFDNRYHFLAFIGGKSFRKIKFNDKCRIRRQLQTTLKRQVDEQKVKSIYNERLAVRLDLYLTEDYLKRVDIDNVAKTVIDCLNGICWKDDKQILSLDVIKSRTDKGAIGITIGRFLRFRCIYG